MWQSRKSRSLVPNRRKIFQAERDKTDIQRKRKYVSACMLSRFSTCAQPALQFTLKESNDCSTHSGWSWLEATVRAALCLVSLLHPGAESQTCSPVIFSFSGGF